MELMPDRRSVPSPVSNAAMSTTAAALVLLCCGDPDQIGALQAAAALPVASLLNLPLERGLQAPTSLSNPQQALAALPVACLAPLGVDAGMPLGGHGHWAEQLGAARQCCLLLVSAEQLNSGVAAATTALLQHWQVPLLGLIQWSAPWNGEARRRDGLPWLGWLEADASTTGESAAALNDAARLRWQMLAAERR
jgi:hypothetical protein